MRLMWVVLLLQIAATFGLSQEKALPTKAVSVSSVSLSLMTPEEEAVRTAYAKFSFAARIALLSHAVEKFPGGPGLDNPLALTKAMDDEIRFDLTDFKVGKVRDIYSKPASTLFEGPVGLLNVQTGERADEFTKDGITKKYNVTYADVDWQPKPPPSPDLTQEHRTKTGKLTPTVEDMLYPMRKPNSGGEWTRYVSYSVVASLRGRTLSYRASFIFSGNGEMEDTMSLDFATLMSPGFFVNNPMYPSLLVDTAYREIPYIQAWIVANQIAGCKKTKQPEVCCDASTGECGLATEDVQKSMDVPIDPSWRWLAQH